MNQSYIDAIQAVQQPKLDDNCFFGDLKSPLKYVFKDGEPAKGFLSNGVRFVVDYPEAEKEVETAFISLRRVLDSKKVSVSKSGEYPIVVKKDERLKHEEYALCITEKQAEIKAADEDGLRRAIYFLEDKLCEQDAQCATVGDWRRSPFVKNRISRCFFGPTYRPPFFIDELTNDIDYYPEEYLNKLAHEGINGVWLSMYFRDLPSSIFAGRGKDSEKRFAKLRLTVERCLRYGIRIFVYVCEPKFFGKGNFRVNISDALEHREVLGMKDRDSATADSAAPFCTSSETGRRYLYESVKTLFTAVPKLGGLINIIMGEDNGSCANMLVHGWPCDCPECTKRSLAEIYREMAKVKADAMHSVSPEAELIEWFYSPGSRDGGKFAKTIEEIVCNWNEDCSVMLNFESGGVSRQLGKGRIIFDYSLAYIGPSELFRAMASSSRKTAAKMQVGCSHENASVPFIPVPSNLFEKYKILNHYQVSTVMQCWYFGNYPGLMNKAAGELSFEPFPQSEDEFLLALARPNWREHSPVAVEAWKHFARGYRNFPANIEFAWYGPMHQCISWPLYLFPVDMGITPSWLLKNFPEVSGDRIGECLVFQHTLDEALTLCSMMQSEWRQGVELMTALAEPFANNPDRLADIILAKAIMLQIDSTCNMLKFYQLREDMLFCKHDNLNAMKSLVEAEIVNSKEMKELCLKDSRLGYHSEAEGYLFFPEKLDRRIEALQALLDEDFPRFSLEDEWIKEYTGEKLTGKVADAPMGKTGTLQKFDNADISWNATRDEDNLYITIYGLPMEKRTVYEYSEACIIEIEPRRMWEPALIMINPDGTVKLEEFLFSNPLPISSCEGSDGSVRIGIPLALFDGFRREGFPMRINIRIRDKAWVAGKTWPARLTHRDYNPKMAGWLVLQ